MSEATVLLNAVQQGDPKAADALLTLVYEELRHLASLKMARQAPGQTLQPTALVHEAWLKLVGPKNPSFNDRGHFFAAAAEAMRQILIDRARRRQTRRHGGDLERVPIDDVDLATPDLDEQLLGVNEALNEFSRKYPVQAEIVKMRYFMGMTNEEVAQLRGISVSTVKNYWNFSRAWLIREISADLPIRS